MKLDVMFRVVFTASTIAMVAIRITYQRRVPSDGGRVCIREGRASLAAGAIAALVTVVFGLEYILSPGVFAFAYAFRYPVWLRGVGGALLAGGVGLLASAHHHLGTSFHSLVVTKDGQVLVDSGPYRWIRHPIYLAYLLDYLGGGLLASNLVLTIVPVVAYTVLVALRMGREEAAMIDQFGEGYIDYIGRSGRLLPWLKSGAARTRMTHTYWFYLKGIFIDPATAAKAILEEVRLARVAWMSFWIGVLSYVVIVALGYSAIGWGRFPYTDYYPHYFSPYWWEFLVLPVWGAVLALGYGLPSYLIGRLLGGSGTWTQVLAFVLLASVVSLPIFLLVDAYTVIWQPELIIEFAKFGQAGVTPDLYTSEIFRFAHTWYSYITMAWQGIVTVIGLAVIHRIKWYKNVPGLVVGSGIFTLFLLLIRDYVALII